MKIVTQAFSRAGLMGNPGDGYCGKALALSVRNFSAQATIEPSARLCIAPQRQDLLEFDNVQQLVRGVREHGYYGGVRLLKATIKLFAEHCIARGIELRPDCFTISYCTTIPVQVGLAGSSAIITAAMRALMRFYNVEIERELLPSLILSVEREELGIGAGLMDRVIQVYEGLVFMDLGRELVEGRGLGDYVPLDPAALPPLYLAYNEGLAKGSEFTHNPLRARFERGEPEMLAKVAQLAELAVRARELLEHGRGDELGSLMDENFDLRAALCNIGPGDMQLINIGRELGAHPKFAGSGGAVIGAFDGDPQRLERLRRAYAKIDATLIVPQIAAEED
ncbi:MAG: hypothetical protein P9M14_11325 [Candidatus Alcyoniella australis]|nr:hypothetical protein [Candidatus Alcyoniella australis]